MITSKNTPYATKTQITHMIFKNSIILILAFLISDIVLLDQFSPFAIALLAFCFLDNGISPLFCLLGSVISISVFGQGDLIQKYIELVNLFIILAIAKRFIALKKWHFGLFILACKVITIVIFKRYLDDTIYYSLGEALLSSGIFFMLICCYRCIWNILSNRKISNEQVLSLFAILFILLLSFSSLNFQQIYLSRILIVLLCLTSCYIFEGYLSVMIALTAGFIYTVITKSDFLFMVNLIIAAFATRFFSKFKRFFVVLSFILVDVIVGYTVSNVDIFLNYGIEMLVASFIFYALPEIAFEKTKRLFRFKDERKNKNELHLQRFKKMTSSRLCEISSVFKNTGDLFISTAKENMNHKGNASKVIGYLAKEVCYSCDSLENCWENNFLETYNAINSMFICYENQGEIAMEEETKRFLGTCQHPKALYDYADALFSNYLINLKWKKKVDESKLVAGEQLCGVSRVITDISKKISDGFVFLEKVEDDIYENLSLMGYRPNEVCVEDSACGMSVAVNMKACNGEKKCKKSVEKCVSIACGKKMMLVDERCTGYGKNRCITRYQQLKRFSIYTGLASVAKKGVCGDSHSFYGLENGKYMMLICDGMGSGSKARRESEGTAMLLENFFHAEFDEKTILSTINKLLILKSPDEMFSTVDMCVIDLVKGKLKFTKIGAPHSYLIRNSQANKITPGALPIGILDGFSPMVEQRDIVDGDLIVMFSDGVADVHDEDGDWLIEAIGKTKNPQVVADRILAVTLDGEKQKDDITVIVGRIAQRSA
jgi:stage II sporulation protein E